MAKELTDRQANIAEAHDALLNRFEGILRLLYPEEMTPTAKRIIESMIEEERSRWR